MASLDPDWHSAFLTTWKNTDISFFTLVLNISWRISLYTAAVLVFFGPIIWHLTIISPGTWKNLTFHFQHWFQYTSFFEWNGIHWTWHVPVPISGMASSIFHYFYYQAYSEYHYFIFQFFLNIPAIWWFLLWTGILWTSVVRARHVTGQDRDQQLAFLLFYNLTYAKYWHFIFHCRSQYSSNLMIF